MRALVLTCLLTSSVFALGCTSSGGSAEADAEDQVQVKAILTGVDKQSVSVRDLEVELLGSSPVKHGKDELLFLVSDKSDDYLVYPLAKIESVEFLEPGGERKFLHLVKLTLESGKILELYLFRFAKLKGNTLDERSPFERRVETLSRIDVLNDATKK